MKCQLPESSVRKYVTSPAACLFAFVSTCAGCALLGDGMVLPTTAHVAGLWVGSSANRVDFFGVELNESGSGWFAVSFHDSKTLIAPIDHWRIIGRRIKIDIADEHNQLLEMKVTDLTVAGNSMVLTVKDAFNRQSKATLVKETDLQENIDRIKSAIENKH